MYSSVIKNIAKCCILITSASAIFAPCYASQDEPSCLVIGIRQPGTNIYNGPTFCEAISLSYITVRGPLTLTKTNISGLTNVSGPIRASGAVLNNVELNENFSHVTFELNSASIVNGDITFKGRSGIVKLSADSAIHGKVINGKVIPATKTATKK